MVKKKFVSILIPYSVQKNMSRLVKLGYFNNTTELIRFSIYKLLDEYRDVLNDNLNNDEINNDEG